MPTCMMITCMLQIHGLGVLCAASMKPHSQTSRVAMCDSGDVCLEAYIRLTAYDDAPSKGMTSIRQSALENGDRTHALSRMPSLARALRGLTNRSRVLPCTPHASVHAWRVCRACHGRALVPASARSYGCDAHGSIAFTSLSRGARAHRPSAEAACGRLLGRLGGAGACSSVLCARQPCSTKLPWP